MSVGIKIAIPYFEAKNLDLLDEQEKIIVEKVLEDKVLIKKYCYITQISR